MTAMHDNRYFDNAATTEISEEALRTYVSVSKECFANPSSKHKDGLKAKKRLEDLRKIFGFWGGFCFLQRNERTAGYKAVGRLV